MHCQTCGAEIGNRKVCPFCDTPIRNVLVGGFQLTNPSLEEGAVGDTTVIRQTDMDNPTPAEKSSPTMTESLSAVEKLPVVEKKVWGSVIPDLTEVSNKTKPKSKKRKWIIITAVVFSVLLIATATVFFVLRNKKKNAYIEGLKEVSVSFRESVDTNPGEAKKTLYQSMLSGVEPTAFWISSTGNYAAYEVESIRTEWVSDRSEAGGYEKTIYVFDLYLLSESRERLYIARFEQEEGRVDLLGVTDQGVLVFNDTEDGKSYQISDDGTGTEIGGLIEKGLFYASGEAVFLTQDGQLYTSGKGGNRLLSSGVTGFSFLDGVKYYGYLRPVEKITSSDSELRQVVYESEGSLYRKDLEDPKVGGERWEGTLPQTPESVLYDTELKEVSLPEADLRGDGSFSFEEGELIFRGGGFCRNLGKADQVVCLAGDEIYVMRNGKLIRINVFSKDEEEIADHGMELIVR